MNNFDELFKKIKMASDDGNLIIPKSYLKKFILSNMLTCKNSQNIDRDKIFEYLNGDKFELPSAFEQLDDEKSKKYLQTLECLIGLFYND